MPPAEQQQSRPPTPLTWTVGVQTMYRESEAQTGESFRLVRIQTGGDKGKLGCRQVRSEAADRKGCKQVSAAHS